MVVEAVRRFFERHAISSERVVVACSGGADSTALLLALHELGRDILCAHVNHHLRGEESDADEQFVRDLCEQRKIAFIVCDGTITDDAIKQFGLEAAARNVRTEQLKQLGENLIATAHQKNDQAETIVMRLMTGTGLAGLRGIHEVRDDGFIRPLLNVTREEINAYLAAKNITPRIDRMNHDPRFLRNRVRAALEQFSAGTVNDIAAVAAQAQQLWPAIEQTLDLADCEHVHITRDATHFLSWPQDDWLKRALLLRHIQRLDPHSRDISSKDLERLTTTDIKRVSVTKDLELIKRNGSLILRRLPQPTPEFELEVRAGTRVYINEIDATIEINPSTRQPVNPSTFVVRNRRHGDRFKHKKVKEILIDRKIPAEVRDRLPLIVCDGEIVGIGETNRFQVTSPTGELFEVMLEHGRKDQVEIQR